MTQSTHTQKVHVENLKQRLKIQDIEDCLTKSP